MAPSVAMLIQEATQLHRQGRLPDAERLYRAVLAQQPKSFEALYMLGLLKMQQGQPAEAAELVSAAVKRNPASGEALTLLGSILLNLKRTEEALGCFDRLVVAQPGNIEARYNRAVVLGEMGRLPQALAGYDQVVAVLPRHDAAWFNRGNVLARLARFDDAVASYDRALALSPKSPELHNNRGNALAALGRHGEALAGFDLALSLRANFVDALSNRAASLRALGRGAEALTSCQQALALAPHHGNVLVTHGNLLMDLDRLEEALQFYDRALAIAPSDIEIAKGRSTCLIGLGRTEQALSEAEQLVARDPGNAAAYGVRARALSALLRDEEAIRDYQRAIELQPGDAAGYFGLGATLQAQERHAEAIAPLAKGMALQPNGPEGRLQAGEAYLCLGRFDEGWPLYESRWERAVTSSPLRRYPQPRWDGSRVNMLLVWGEQGVGDQVLHASMFPDLAQYADKVVVEAEPRLVGLFARSFPEFDIVGYRPELYGGRIDAQTPGGSLGRRLRHSFDVFPQRTRGYLVPDAARVKQLRERLASDGRPVIGLSWISRNKKFASFKSAQLMDFRALLQSPAYRFVDLQYGDTAAERDAVERDLGVRVERVADVDNTNDLDGLAALIAACDAVLTVSSTTAHLAGAVGTPAWVMVPFGRGRFWYWFADRPVSPWYPTVQVRRQGAGRPWAELIAAIAPEIEASLKATG